MNFLILFCSLIFSTLAIATYDIKENWDENLRPVVTFSCPKNSKVCIRLCGHQMSCTIKSMNCVNCISSGSQMYYLFNSFGRQIRAADEVSVYELLDFLKIGNFISFSGATIYNQFDSASSGAAQERFRQLCENGYENPITFFELVGRNLDVSKARFLACGSSIYRLKFTSEENLLEKNP
jgi:hypothetical protein